MPTNLQGFLGMRGTGDFSADERPQNWRQLVLFLFPNGSAPLTAILSKLKEEKTTDPVFNWWEKPLPIQGGDLTDVYIDANLTTPYVYSTHQATYGVKGATLFAKVAEAVASHFRPGHEVMLRDEDRTDFVQVGIVTAVVKNGANSYIAFNLVHDDDSSLDPANVNIGTADKIYVSGSAHAEGAEMPEAVSYRPVKKFNYTQIFRTKLSLTRTAQRTKLRTGDAYQDMKIEALDFHSIEMEKAFIWGEREERTDPTTNKPLRLTRGIYWWIRKDPDAVFSDYRLDNPGKKWISGGEDWLDSKLEQIARWNANKELLGLAGSGFLLGLQKLAKLTGQVQLQPRTAAYGLQVTTWITPFNTVQIVTHPLLSQASTFRNMCIIGDPRRLIYRYIDDTTFKPDKLFEGGANSKDAREEEFLTECGLELHHPIGWAILDGGGLDG